MVRTGTLVLLMLLAVGCSAGNGSEPSASDTSETAEAPETLRVERISSEAPGQGPQKPRVVLSPSAAALSRETGARVPTPGEGTYLAAYWGEKPTGGYSLAARSARLEGDRVTVRLALEEPPPDAIVTQALTYPYVVAVMRGLDPAGKDFLFVDQRGRLLDWPLRRVGG